MADSLQHGRYLLVAGTGGIAQATAQRLQVSGARLFLTGRHQERLDRAAASVNAEGTCLCAADQFDEVIAAFEKAHACLGGLDGVALFAGSLLLKPAHLTSEAEFDATVRDHLKTAFAVVRAAGKFMTSTGGSVVLVSSTAALHGLANHEAIAAVKAGIIGLVQSAAATYASANLRFNAVAPGLTETSLTASLTGNETSRKISQSMHPLGRLGTPQQIASAICWLLAPENDWTTGQVLAVDGGLSRVAPKFKA